MDRFRRRAIGYIIILAISLVLTALGYQYLMGRYEGRPRPFIDALQFAVEMYTTTGFGGDSPWESWQLNVFIILTDIYGMVLLVGALPVFLGPILQNVLSVTIPTEADASLSDHVIICSHTDRAEELIKELESNNIPYLIVERDRTRVEELVEDDYNVIRGDPTSESGLRAARLQEAQAIYVDQDDQIDASIVLTAKDLNESVPVVSVVENPDREQYHRLAGADYVLSPRTLIGESLASKITLAVRTELTETLSLDAGVQLAEIPIQRGSPLIGSTLVENNIRERTGVNVIGAWDQGKFIPTPSSNLVLSQEMVLLVLGTRSQLDQFISLTQSTTYQFRTGNTLILGYGQVGKTVAEQLDDHQIPHTIVDQTDSEAVDVVGDATDPAVLKAAGIDDAETIVLALPDDTTTEYATLVVRDLAPEAEVVARVQRSGNISKTHRAGADYVLSLASVTGRLSVSRLLEDRDVLSVDQQLSMIKTSVPALAGQTLREAQIRERTGCTVIAIDREGTLQTDIGADTELQSADQLLLAGTDEDIRAFEEQFVAVS